MNERLDGFIVHPLDAFPSNRQLNGNLNRIPANTAYLDGFKVHPIDLFVSNDYNNNANKAFNYNLAYNPILQQNYNLINSYDIYQYNNQYQIPTKMSLYEPQVQSNIIVNNEFPYNRSIIDNNVELYQNYQNYNNLNYLPAKRNELYYEPLIATHNKNKSIYLEPELQNANNLNYIQQQPIMEIPNKNNVFDAQYQPTFGAQQQSIFEIQNQSIYGNSQSNFYNVQQPQAVDFQQQSIYNLKNDIQQPTDLDIQQQYTISENQQIPIYDIQDKSILNIQQNPNIKFINMPKIITIKNNNININEMQYENYTPRNNLNYIIPYSRNNNLYTNVIQPQPQIIKKVVYENYPVTKGSNISNINNLNLKSPQVINPIINNKINKYNLKPILNIANINNPPVKIKKHDLLKSNKHLYSNIFYNKNVNINNINNNNDKTKNLNLNLDKKNIPYNTSSYEPIDTGIGETKNNLEGSLKSLRNYFNSPIHDNITDINLSRVYSSPTRIVPTKRSIIMSTKEAIGIPNETPMVIPNISTSIFATPQKMPVMQSYYGQPYSTIKKSIKRRNKLSTSILLIPKNNYNYSSHTMVGLNPSISQIQYNSGPLNEMNSRTIVVPRKKSFIIQSNRPITTISTIPTNSPINYNVVTFIPKRNTQRSIYIPNYLN